MLVCDSKTKYYFCPVCECPCLSEINAKNHCKLPKQIKKRKKVYRPTCARCHSKFNAPTPIKKFCPDCHPKCSGCGKIFPTHYISDEKRYCRKCQRKQ